MAGLVTTQQFPGLVPDVGRALQGGLQFAQGLQGMQAQRQAMQRQQQQSDIQEFEFQDAREKARAQSVFKGALEIQPMLSQGDTVGALKTLSRRKEALDTAGIDSSDTQEMIDIIDKGNINEALSLSNQMIDFGVRMGLDPTQAIGLERERVKTAQAQQLTREEELALEKEKFEAGKGKLSSFMTKALDASQTQAIQSARNADEYMILVGDIENLESQVGEIGGGSATTVYEAVKQASGNQDAVSEIRTRYRAVRLGEGLKNLPPGPATDKDVEEAFKGVPPENASGERMKSFLRGVAKLEFLNSEFNKLKSRIIEEQGNTRGLIDEWKAHAETLDLNQFGKTMTQAAIGPRSANVSSSVQEAEEQQTPNDLTPEELRELEELRARFPSGNP